LSIVIKENQRGEIKTKKRRLKGNQYRKKRGRGGENIMNIILINNTNSSLATPESKITRLSKICVKHRIKRYVPPSVKKITPNSLTY